MFHHLITATLLTLPLLATATPLNLPTRDNGPGIYACTAENWGGDCYWSAAPLNGACHTAQHNIKSYGPDKGLDCSVYETGDCNAAGGKAGGFQFPGEGKMLWDERVMHAGIGYLGVGAVRVSEMAYLSWGVKRGIFFFGYESYEGKVCLETNR